MRLLHYSDIENAHDDPERIARLAGLVAERRGDDAVVCGTGDNIAPGVLPLVTRGEIALEFYDVLRPDFSTFGNHDFDFGVDRLAEIVDRSPQQWITANVLDAGEPFADAVRWSIRRVDGERVGFVGVTDPTANNAHPDAADLTFTDPIKAVLRTIDSIGDHVDRVVVLSHLGRGDDRLAGACDVDAILGGHVHSERVVRIDETVLMRPGTGGETLLELDLESKDVHRHAVADGPPAEDLAVRYRDRLRASGLDEPVGRVDEPIARREREAFRGESRVGNFVADAYRWAAEREIDAPVVGLQNSGGIRTGPPLDGEVTLADLVSLVPFDEPVVVVELTGAELRDVFREAAETTGFGEADWWHAHVSGARLVYDYADDTLLDALVYGAPIAPEDRYALSTSEFLLNTKEEFPTLTDRTPIRTLDVQYEVLAEYARECGIDPELDGRVVRNGLSKQ